MKILLIEPKKSVKYHTQYPPLGLLKLAAFYKARKHEVRFVQGFSDDGFQPDLINITSLFTYAYEPVHEVISYYSEKYKKTQISVGGIYATLCAHHLKETFKNRIEIHKGLVEEAENSLPDYSLVPGWDTSIIFSTRGCIRECHFCSVPKLEPKFKARKSIKHLIYPGHKKVVFWDNNILASPYWKDIFAEIEEMNLTVDFNQGLDARLLNEEIALELIKLKIPKVRLAYDSEGIKRPLQKAITILKNIGINGRRIIVYCLYNHYDTPENFLARVKDLAEWEVVAYPMRYEPLEPKPKNTYVAKNWTKEELEMVASARRVIGYGGAFPPHDGLKRKFIDSNNFVQAFGLRPKINPKTPL